MKKCIQCGEVKDISEFYEDSRIKDGYRNKCKECTKLNNKKWRQENKQKVNEINKNWRQENKDKVREYDKKFRNTDKRKQYLKKWKEINTNYYSEYFKENKSIFYDRAKEWRENNKEYYKNYYKEYYKNNKDKIIRQHVKYNKDYYKNRRKNDPIFMLYHSISTNLRNSLKNDGYKKNSRTFEVLGCSYDFFVRYIESKFEHWMNWENYGKYNGEFNFGWDIDHIIPINEANSECDIIKLFHYTNLQPLCSKINRYIKRDKLDYE